MEVHIFDIDHTLIRRSTTYCFIKTGLKNKLITTPQLLKVPLQVLLYKLAVIGPKFIEKEVRKHSNIPVDLLETLSRESFEEHGKKQLYSEGVELLNELKKKGHRIIAATSSIDFFIKPITEFLGIEEYIATNLEFSNGKTTGRTVGDAAFGKGKLKAVEDYFNERKLSFNQAVFYSDSYNDLPLLKACRRAVPVNPDRRLKKEAKERGWNCLFFKETLDS